MQVKTTVTHKQAQALLADALGVLPEDINICAIDDDGQPRTARLSVDVCTDSKQLRKIERTLDRLKVAE